MRYLSMNLKTFVKCFGVALTTIVLANLALFALSYSGTSSLVGDECSQLYYSVVVLYNILVFFSALLACMVFFAITLKEKHNPPQHAVKKPEKG